MGKRKSECTPEEWAAYLQKQREWQTNNRKPLTQEQIEARRKASRLWRAKNADKVRQSDNAWRARNREQVRAKNRLWRKKNQNHVRLYNAEYWRRRKAGLATSLPIAQKVHHDPVAALRAALLKVPDYRNVWDAIHIKNTDRREDIASEAIVILLENPGLPVPEAVSIARRTLNRAIGSLGMISLDQPRLSGQSWHDILAAPAREVAA